MNFMKSFNFLNLTKKQFFLPFKVVVVLLVSMVFFASCNDDDEDENPDTEKNIAQLVRDTENLSSLEAALEKTNLLSTFEANTEYTVFAPTNDAFDTFLASKGLTLETALTDQLDSLLRRHVISGKIKSDALATRQNITALSSDTLDIETTGSLIRINNATVTEADIEVSNGVVHIIDEVIE